MSVWALFDDLTTTTTEVALPAVAKPVTPIIRQDLLPPRRVDGNIDPMALPTDARLKAQERLEFCRAVVDMNERSGRSLEECCRMVSLRDADRFPKLLHGGKNHSSQLTFTNYCNWTRKLGRDSRGRICWKNAAALCDDYLRGAQPLKGDSVFWETFDRFFLHQAELSIPESYRLAAMTVRQEYPLAKIPNEHQCRHWVKKMDLASVVLARQGEEALKNGFLDFIRRDWKDVRSGELYVADHHELDFWVRVQGDEPNTWKAVRPYLCGLIDAKSWYSPGWQIVAYNPNCNTIINTLGLAIHNNDFRPPCFYYCDNGADFLKTGFNKPAEFEGKQHSILGELGIKDITAIAYNARAKPIERHFRDLATSFSKWFASYLGNTPIARPDISEYFRKHPEELLSLEQVCQLFSGWLDIYHNRPKHGNIHGGKSPMEIWNARPELRPAMSKDVLKYAMLMPLDTTRTVHQGPAISVNKVEYYHAALWPYMKRQVMVKEDINDPEHVFAYKTDGTLITECVTRARCKALALHPDDKAQIAAGMKNQADQKKYAYTVLASYTGGKKVISPLELLLAGPNADIVKIGEQKSVKGPSHLLQYNRLAGATSGDALFEAAAKSNILNLPLPVRATDGDMAEFPALEFKEDREEAKLAAFEAAVIAPETEPESPADQKTIADFHAFMTRRPGDEEEE